MIKRREQKENTEVAHSVTTRHKMKFYMVEAAGVYAVSLLISSFIHITLLDY